MRNASYSGWSVKADNGLRYVATKGIKTIYPVRVYLYKKGGLYYIEQTNGETIKVYPKDVHAHADGLPAPKGAPVSNGTGVGAVKGTQAPSSPIWYKALPIIALGAAGYLAYRGAANWGKYIAYGLCGISIGGIPYALYSINDKSKSIASVVDSTSFNDAILTAIKSGEKLTEALDAQLKIAETNLKKQNQGK